jgi:hypothetical protein
MLQILRCATDLCYHTTYTLFAYNIYKEYRLRIFVLKMKEKQCLYTVSVPISLSL